MTTDVGRLYRFGRITDQTVLMAKVWDSPTRPCCYDRLQRSGLLLTVAHAKIYQCFHLLIDGAVSFFQQSAWVSILNSNDLVQPPRTMRPNHTLENTSLRVAIFAPKNVLISKHPRMNHCQEKPLACLCACQLSRSYPWLQ